MSFPRQTRPCAGCPWRRDTRPGEFPASRYDALRKTAPGPHGESVGLGEPMFGCHKSDEERTLACAGWLAVCGYDHVTVRLAVIQGDLPAEALKPGADWPPLFEDYESMAAVMGIDR